MSTIANGPNLPVPCPTSPLEYFPALRYLGLCGEERAQLQENADEASAWALSRLKRILTPDGRLPAFHFDAAVANDHHTNLIAGGKQLSGIEARALIVLILASDSYWASPQNVVLAEYLESHVLDKSREGYVYCLHGVGTCFYKIGHSNSISRRIKEISPKVPFPLELVHYIHTDDRYELEAKFHRQFASKRKEGEWFELDEYDLGQFADWGRSVKMCDLFESEDDFLNLQGYSEIDPWREERLAPVDDFLNWPPRHLKEVES